MSWILLKILEVGVTLLEYSGLLMITDIGTDEERIRMTGL